jgi:hypothetical protein
MRQVLMRISPLTENSAQLFMLQELTWLQLKVLQVDTIQSQTKT